MKTKLSGSSRHCRRGTIICACLLGLVPAAWSASEPILRNSMTTNSPGTIPNALATSTSPLYPLTILVPDGSGTNRVIMYSPNFHMDNGTGVFDGNLQLNILGGGAVLGLNGGKQIFQVTIGTGLTFASGTLSIENSATNYILNLYVSNLFVINGKVHDLIVTNSITVTNALIPIQVGANKLVATAADGAVTNADGVFTTRGSVFYKGASGWTALVPNTAGYILTDGGIGADPAWAAAPAGGLATSGSAYVIVGGNASATANWTALSNAYVTAKSATPNGSALATGNRYTVFLLPGKYDLGASTLTLDTLYIDFVGLSPNTGPYVYSGSHTDLGDTVLTSTGNTILINVTTDTSSHDIDLVNLGIETTTASSSVFAFQTSQAGWGSKLQMTNIRMEHNGSANPKLTMQNDKNVAGTWTDVRIWQQRAFGEALLSSITVNGTFIRCKSAEKGFGRVANPGSTVPTLSGTFIDCECDADGFGVTSTAAGAVLSGNFIRVRMVGAVGGAGAFLGGTGATMSGNFLHCIGDVNYNNYGGGAMSGTMVACSGTAAISWTSLTGSITGCNFSGWTDNVLASRAVDAAVNIAATGWTNTFTKNATVYFDGGNITFKVFNSALTAIYTNAVAVSNATVLLQPAGKVTITGDSVTGRAVPF